MFTFRFSNKYLSLLLIYLMCNVSANATVYYISNEGDDNNSGTLESVPWQTIEKVNNSLSTFLPGDSILFAKGSIFNNQLEINDFSGSSGAPLFFGAYGSGVKPIILGSRRIDTWTNTSGNIWHASCPNYSNRVPSLYIDNQFQPIGRFPNTEYRTISSTSNETQIIDLGLESPANHWDGGEIVIKTRRWFIKILDITNSWGDTINFVKNTSYSITPKFGYFVQNHINTLDIKPT